MRKATICLVIAFLAGAWTASAQDSEYLFDVPVSEDVMEPYAAGIHSGARDVVGPVDLDNDGQMEVVVSDYTGGGRAHVIENAGPDIWEWVYSTPWVDSTASTENIRAIGAGFLDADDFGEIVFFAGREYDEETGLEPGLYVYEFNGTDFGTEPASIYQFGDHIPDRWRMERIEIQDIDGDGVNEVMFGNNGGDAESDVWYILSVTGDIGGGFEVWVEEARLTASSTDADAVNRGGGSPYYIGAGDFDGDGVTDLTLHSWNFFNLTTGRVVGPNTYEFPAEGASNANLYVTDPDDHVAIFGGTVIDIDGDGNDEVFYPNLETGEAVLLNYDEGENTLEVTEDNVVVNIFGGAFSTLGIGSGDLDGDGRMEVFGSGPSYTGSAFTNGELPTFFRIAEYQSGNVEAPGSYTLEDIDYFEPFDTTAFDIVHRDSAGVDSTYYEDGAQGPEFVSKFAYLGDVDGDGFNELAIAFQGIDDSTFTIEETYNPDTEMYDREFVDSAVRQNRVFMRVLQGTGLSVKVVDEQVILPSDYKLSDNYPNPFNPSTSFSFTLPVDKSVSVKIYDVSGRLVQTLVNNELRPAGTYEVSWDGTNRSGQAVASGTYIYTLEWGQFRQSKTMVLVK